MIEAGLTAKAIVAMLGVLAVHGTIVAMLALVLVRAGKLRPAWQAAVWLVVLAKFALPWGPSLPWSFSDVLALFASDGGGAAVVLPAANGASAAASPSIGPAIGWLVLAIVWAIGTLIVLLRGVTRHLSTVRGARAAHDAPAFAQQLIEELAARVRVKRPRLVVGDAVTGPYVVGVVRPTIVVPPALLDDATLLRAALLHELAHVKRRDALGCVIQLAAVALFWWLPVVRLASRQLELARERACDAWALESGDVSRPAYARLLLAMAQLRAPQPALAAPHALDARVTAVLGPVVRPRLAVWQKLAIAIWAVAVLGGARSSEAAAKREACVYTPEVAEALRQAYPEADLDQDGVLSHDEACDLQAEMRARPDEYPTSGPVTVMATEPLCCNCDSDAQPTNTCSLEGVSR